jgi:hypothetical protein
MSFSMWHKIIYFVTRAENIILPARVSSYLRQKQSRELETVKSKQNFFV